MLFRAFVCTSGQLKKLTIDCQSSTGFDSAGAFGQAALAGTAIPMYSPTSQAFGKKQLQEWVDSVGFPYP
jgi:hypothetical protein